MSGFEFATVAVQALQIATIWFGIWVMKRSSDQRRETDRERHQELMVALGTPDRL